MEIIAVEVFDGHIRIDYADGSREDVSGGVYERKDARGKTVEERAATAADIDRLTALAVEFEAANQPSSAEVIDAQLLGDNIEIEYADGTRDIIENGVYERKDANNETIIERPATEEDAARLAGLAAGFADGGSTGDDGTPDQGSGDAPGTGGGTTSVPAPEPTHVGTESDDEIRGTRGADVIAGLGGDDELRGRRGDDIIDGGAGDDKVKGDAGDDVLNGGVGSDIYDGGVGADTFVFEADGALDKISDFVSGVDVIDLTAYGFANGAEVLSYATEQGGDVYFDFGGGDVLKVDDTTLAQIDETDFLV